MSVVSFVCCQRFLRQADHSSRGVLPTVVCRCVWSRNHKNPREWGRGQDPLGDYRAETERQRNDAIISKIYLGMKLYMFRTVPLPIVRSLFIVHSALVYFIQVWRKLSDRTRMELQFHPGPAQKLSTNLYDIYHYWVYS